MDIDHQEKNGPTVDYYPDGHHLSGQLIFYAEWLVLNPYRKLTDIARWHALHEALINEFVETKKEAQIARKALRADSDPTAISRKVDTVPFVGDLSGSLSKAVADMVAPTRGPVVGETFPEPIEDYSEEFITTITENEDTEDELS